MKILITDDESLARARLRGLIEELGHQVVAEAASGEEAISLCQQSLPDVILLDIRMPGMGGLETARHMMALDSAPAVIFTTAYDQHALQAFDANAVDYLLKPVRQERLAQALDKLSLQGGSIKRPLMIDEESPRTHICARSHNKVSLIPIDQVICFMADQKYISVMTADQETLIEDSLKSLEEEFADRFTRIHRSTLVAIEHISSLQKSRDGGHYLQLKDTSRTLQVSRRHVAGVRKLIKSLG